MSGTYVSLKKFKHDELIFDKEETLEILKFIFKGFIGDARFKTLNVTDNVREFAQGLLVEAIDASYAMGYIEALFKATANPSIGTKKLLKKFAKKALKHWFKHAKKPDLAHIKIYEIVRKQLAANFRTQMLMMITGIASKKVDAKYVAYVDYENNLFEQVMV